MMRLYEFMTFKKSAYYILIILIEVIYYNYLYTVYMCNVVQYNATDYRTYVLLRYIVTIDIKLPVR